MQILVCPGGVQAIAMDMIPRARGETLMVTSKRRVNLSVMAELVRGVW